MRNIFCLAVLVLLSAAALAEQTGTINVTNSNMFVTGLSGTTVMYCNETSNCQDAAGIRCITDFDLVSSGVEKGWCVHSSQSGCAHNNSESSSFILTLTGTSICTNTSSYRSCSSGIWSNETNCTSGQTCNSGSCGTPSTSSGSSSSVIYYNTSRSSVDIVYYPLSFSVLQGGNVTKSVIVSNGNVTQKNLTLTLTGLSNSWYTIIPPVIDSIGPKLNSSFTIYFTIPRDAEFKNYTISLVASSSNASVTDTIGFIVQVLPSTTTIEQVILPSFANYSSSLDGLEAVYNADKANYSDTLQRRIENLIRFARTRINDTSLLIADGRYEDAAVAGGEIEELLENLGNLLLEKDVVEAQSDILLLLILGAGIAAGAVIVAYMFWPHEEKGFSREKGWLPSDGANMMDKIRKLLKIKKSKESYFDEKGKRD
jgi:hypothetical protein